MSYTAATILCQLGGNKFVAMTGAKNFVYDDKSLRFALPARTANKGINRVCVELMPSDTYKVSFYKVKNHGLDTTAVEGLEGVYSDSLQEVFTRVTGLYTSL